MNKKELKFILQQGEGQFYNPISLINSAVVNTLTEDCFLNAGSFDHIGQSNFNARAKNGMSLSCGESCLALDSNSLNTEDGIIEIKCLNSSSADLISKIGKREYLIRPDMLLFNSSIAYSGENNPKLKKSEFIIIDLTGFSLKNEISIFVSTTKSISYHPCSLYRFHIPSLILFPSLKQSSSVNSDFSSILSSFLSNKALLTFSDKNSRTASDTLSSGKELICFFKSSGIDKVIFGILAPLDILGSVYTVKTVQVYKPFGFNGEQKESFNSEQLETFFVDASNNIGIGTLKQNQILNFSSGFARMEYYCKKENAPIPKIRFTDILFYVAFRQNPEYLKLKAVKVGEKVGEKLTENQKKIIWFISKKPYVSARELSILVGISSRKVEENIVKLKKKGLLKRVGPAKGGHWEIIGK